MFPLGMELTSKTALMNRLRVMRMSPECWVVTCMSDIVRMHRTVQAQYTGTNEMGQLTMKGPYFHPKWEIIIYFKLSNFI